MPASDPVATIKRLLIDAGLIEAGQPATIVPLSGGVSCEAWRATTAGGDYAVKMALPQLRVAAEWFAPVERAETEAKWFEVVGRIAPRSVPRLIATLADDHALITEFLPPEQAPVWKQEMIDGRVDPAFAAAVGDALAVIHLTTEQDDQVEQEFSDHAAFRALRVEPFLLFTASKHPVVRDMLLALAEDLEVSRDALVHGDISPKNILVAANGPVFIDAECAVYGDPAFDLAFCATHLLLKTVWLSDHRAALIEATRQLVGGYGARIGPLKAPAIERRLTLLVPALLLARIDGRSPADYIVRDADKALIRDRAVAMLQRPTHDFAALLTDWTEAIS